MILTSKGAAVAGVLCFSLATAAAAQAPQRPAGPDSPPPAGAHGPEQRKMMMERFKQRHEQRFHDLLQIRADQETAFHAFLTAVEPQHRDGEHSRRGPGGPRAGGAPGPGGEAPALTTPERLDRMASRMAERQQRFQQIAGATKAFYAVLSAEQRKAFDEMPMLRQARFEHRMGGHFGGRGRFGGEDRPAFQGPPQQRP